MSVYARIYQFAASVGSLEGYVYKKTGAENLDLSALSVWTDNICQAYNRLPAEILPEFQGFLNQTVGRIIHSLKAALGENHDLVLKLKPMIKGENDLPVSADDFTKKKWFQD